MKQAYAEDKLHRASLEMIDVINKIVDTYTRKGMRLTVRQLYYRLVAGTYIDNNLRSYKNIVRLIGSGRMNGLIDWDAIEDRTRSFVRPAQWESPQALIGAAAAQYDQDRWANQPYRVWVIVEKDALKGVLSIPCTKYHVPLLAARGYPSLSTMKEFADQQLLPSRKQTLRILHMGDHDPSGIDMSRDIAERLQLFTNYSLEIEYLRLALNKDQVDLYRLPENPVKQSDTRSKEYAEKFGESCWELDALEPEVLNGKILGPHISSHIDMAAWQAMESEVMEKRKRLRTLTQWYKVQERIDGIR